MLVETLHAPGGDRGGVQEFEERLGLASDLPFGGTAGGGPHFRLFPGVLLAGDPAATVGCLGTWADIQGGAGNVGWGANAGFGSADNRRTMAGDEPLYAAGEGRGFVAGTTENEAARLTTTPSEHRKNADQLKSEFKKCSEDLCRRISKNPRKSSGCQKKCPSGESWINYAFMNFPFLRQRS